MCSLVILSQIARGRNKQFAGMQWKPSLKATWKRLHSRLIFKRLSLAGLFGDIWPSFIMQWPYHREKRGWCNECVSTTDKGVVQELAIVSYKAFLRTNFKVGQWTTISQGGGGGNYISRHISSNDEYLDCSPQYRREGLLAEILSWPY